MIGALLASNHCILFWKRISVVLFLNVRPLSAFRLPVKTNVLSSPISSIRSDQWSMIILIWLLTRSNVLFLGVSIYWIQNQLQNECDIVIKNVIFNQILSMQFAWRNRCIILHLIVIFAGCLLGWRKMLKLLI